MTSPTPTAVTCREAAEYLRSLGLLSSSSATDDRAITALGSLDASVPGGLGWVSPRVARRGRDAARSFGGVALIVPADADLDGPAGVTILASPQPKLAFARLVNRFLDHLVGIRFPTAGESPISPHASIAADAVLGHGVVVCAGCTIGPGCVIGPGTVLANATIGARSSIGAQCAIGLAGFGFERDDSGRLWRFPHVGRVVIGEDVEIGSNTCIDRGSLGNTVIDDGAKIDNLVHVAHNVRIGRDAVVIACSMIGGSTTIADRAWIAPSASLMNQIRVGEGATVGLGAVVLKDVAAAEVVVGNPARRLERRS